ncbi:MAG TPA: GGDEF domain-containing protein [Holophaga sp.]|jgi:diguanylate cyclase (GGDEF)-like protein|nr:GGDEF domain-containing protein [Holophaga sp.]
MPRIFWREPHPSPSSLRLRQALADWGFIIEDGQSEGSQIIVADRPDPGLIPVNAPEVLWWVKDGSPEEVSEVLSQCPGWVVRQDSPLEAVKSALEHLRNRDLGSEGWLRQMLHLATLDELLRPVLARVMELSEARHGAIWIRQDDAFFQRCGEGFAEAPIPLADAAALVRTGQAWLLCPGTQMGILRLYHPKGLPEHFLGWIRDVEDLLINAWSLEVSQALSFRDDLTVAHNRRCLEVELPKAVRDAAARNESVSLLFLDVDNLKALNSLYGHPVGSKVLTTVAQEAQRIIRAQDRLYRYGGDEFCILMPGTTHIGASKLGERLIHTLADAPIAVGDQQLTVSISIGIAAYPAHADGAERLLDRADRALFQAKRQGKGRVALAE